MYGKHFSSMYEGSMVGAGAHVFAVWGYCISNADPDEHTVRLNPKLLSVILGEPVDRIDAAISYLTSADDFSCCTDENGRRLVNTSGMEYLVVSHNHYRGINNSKDRREYMRDYMQKRREKDKLLTDVNDVNVNELTKANPVSVSVSVSEDRDCKGKDELFDLFWKAYPKKKGKGSAFKAFKNALKKADIDTILQAVESQKKDDEWKKENGKFIPYPASWLNDERWQDEELILGETPKPSKTIDWTNIGSALK